MATNPRTPDPSPNEYSDAAATIRFDEPRKLPVGLLAGLAVGVVLVCLIVFFVMFKVNVSPAGGSGPGAANRPAAAPVVQGDPVKSTGGKTIEGAVKEADGEISVSNAPSRCTYLEVHLKNLAEMERNDPKLHEWVEGKRATAKMMMESYNCK